MRLCRPFATSMARAWSSIRTIIDPRTSGDGAAFVLHCPDGPPELRESYGFAGPRQAAQSRLGSCAGRPVQRMKGALWPLLNANSNRLNSACRHCAKPATPWRPALRPPRGADPREPQYRRPDHVFAESGRRSARRVVQRPRPRRNQPSRAGAALAEARRGRVRTGTVARRVWLHALDGHKTTSGRIEQPQRGVRAKAALNRSILDHGWFEFHRAL